MDLKRIFKHPISKIYMERAPVTPPLNNSLVSLVYPPGGVQSGTKKIFLIQKCVYVEGGAYEEVYTHSFNYDGDFKSGIKEDLLWVLHNFFSILTTALSSSVVEIPSLLRKVQLTDRTILFLKGRKFLSSLQNLTPMSPRTP